MKKTCFALLIVGVLGVICALGRPNDVWQTSEAMAFADKPGTKPISDGFAEAEVIRPKPAGNRPTAPLDLAVFDEPPAPPRPATNRPNVSYPPDGIDSLAEADASNEEKAKLTTLREKLAGLAKVKGELINEATLAKEITALEKQISDLHAAQHLQKAKQILSELAEKFPDSPAAIRANRMLEVADGMKPLKLEPEPAREALPTYR